MATVPFVDQRHPAHPHLRARGRGQAAPQRPRPGHPLHRPRRPHYHAGGALPDRNGPGDLRGRHAHGLGQRTGHPRRRRPATQPRAGEPAGQAPHPL